LAGLFYASSAEIQHICHEVATLQNKRRHNEVAKGVPTQLGSNQNRNQAVATRTATRKKLDQASFKEKINELLAKGTPTVDSLLTFAEFINGKPFPEPTLTLTQLKAEVCAVFGCKSATELRKSNEFNLAMTGREFNLRTKADWLKLYREWVGVPTSERSRTGKTCINGIDVLENFRPWHVFSLDPNTASSEDIKEAFRKLAKEHHPDAGGDPRVMERLQKMRDSLLAFR
jgi:hypothetical protein